MDKHLTEPGHHPEKDRFSREVTEELHQILEWWTRRMTDEESGGFHGRIDGHDRLHPEADRGVILNARLVWTFAAAARQTGRANYRAAAERAYRYFIAYFVDEEHGGVYWSVDRDGRVTDDNKQIYAQAFAIYALAEYHDLTRDPKAAELAETVFQLIEAHSVDRGKGGYRNVFYRDWRPHADQRLSDKDEDQSKIMNTHLHVMEAYTNLQRVLPRPATKKALRSVLLLILDKFCARRPRHLYLFFNDDWEPTSEERSFGHDIECAWLLREAAEVLGDHELFARVDTVARELTDAALAGGHSPTGGLIENTDHSGMIPATDKIWWVQAEAIVGLIDADTYNEEKGTYWSQALDIWSFIRTHVIDHEGGEWHWMLDADNVPVRDAEDKAGPWKAPYHNGRMCLEVMRRLQA